MENLVFNKSNNSIINMNLFLNREKATLSKNNNNSIGKYLICPKCNINIPSLPFFINPIEAGSIEILINCKCGNKDRMPLEDYLKFKIPVPNINICEECHSNKPNLKCLFCIDCSKWICEDCRKNLNYLEKNHNYSEYPVNFGQLCDIHINHENLFYCLNCNKELCIKCTKLHEKNHKIINLKDYYNKVKDIQTIKLIEDNINKYYKKNEELKDLCLDNFEKIEYAFEIMSDELNSDLKNINIDKDKFLELYNKNKSLNEQLNKFLHSLYNIFISAQNHPNYNIIHNFEVSSFINELFPKIELNKNNNSNNYYITLYKNIYKYFMENHLISIKSLILMKEENKYLDSYYIKHLLKFDEDNFVFTTDSNIQIFNIKTKKFSDRINEYKKEITIIIKLKNGFISSGSKNGEVEIWSIEDNTILLKNSLSGHEEEIIELLELSDESLLSADKTGKIIIWDINKFKQIQMFLLNMNILSINEISQSEYFIITNNIFMVFQNNKKIIKKNFNNTKILAACFVNSNLICSTDDNKMNVYEINPFKTVKSLSVSNNIIILKKFNDKYLYGISSDYNLVFFKLSNYEQISCITIKTYNFFEFLYMNDNISYCGSKNGLIEWNLNIHDLIDDYVDNIVLI